MHRLVSALAVGLLGIVCALLPSAIVTPAHAQTMRVVQDRTTTSNSSFSTIEPYGNLASFAVYAGSEPLHRVWTSDGTTVTPLSLPFHVDNWTSQHIGIVDNWLVYRSTHALSRGLWTYNIVTGESKRWPINAAVATLVGNVVLLQESNLPAPSAKWRFNPTDGTPPVPIPATQPIPTGGGVVIGDEVFFISRDPAVASSRSTLWSYSLSTGESRSRTPAITVIGTPKGVAGYVVGVERVGQDLFSIFRFDPRTGLMDRRLLNNLGNGTPDNVLATGRHLWCQAYIRPSSGPARRGFVRFDPTNGSLETIPFPSSGHPNSMRMPVTSHDSIYFVGSLPDGAHGAYRLHEQAVAPQLLIGVGQTETSFQITMVHGRAWVIRHDEQRGKELWMFDPATNSTNLVRDVNPGQSDANPFVLGGVGAGVGNGGVTFFAANDGVHGWELWRTDGTPLGTYLLRDFQTGTDGSPVRSLRPLKDRLVYLSDRLLSVSRTTSPEPLLLGEEANSAQFLLQASRTPAGRDVVYFGGLSNSVSRTGLGMTDGTAQGTKILQVAPPLDTLNPCGTMGSGINAAGAVAINGVGVVTSLAAGVATCGPWIVRPGENGQPTTAAPLLTPDPQSFFGAYRFTGTGSQAFFVYLTNQFGLEIGRTDGTPQGTNIVDLVPGIVSGYPDAPISLGSSTYVETAALNGNGGIHRVDVTTGTPTTTLLTSIPNGSSVDDFGVIGNQLLFTTTFGQPRGLWRVDQDTLQRYRVADVYPFANLTPLPSVPPFATVDTKLCFIAAEAQSNGGTPFGDLYAYDDSTRDVQRLVHGSASLDSEAMPAFLTRVKNRLLYAFNDGVHGQELWITDGTPEGTRLWLDAVPGPASSSPTEAAVVGDTLYLAASTPEFGGELYKVQLCPADLTLDFAVTIDDLLAFLVAFENGDPLSDIGNDNGAYLPDGSITIDDLLLYLGAMEQGC